ncbi:MAG: hypothetical protein RI988_620 [Pseudomonadota bacterium]
MADLVTITETAGPQYTWATAAFTWSSASAGKSWTSAYPAVYGIAVAAALALSEARQALPTKAVSEHLGLADALARQVTMRRSETVAFAETYADLIAYVLRFVEFIGFGENLARADHKAISETLSTSDQLSNASTKALAEVVTLGDGLVRSVEKQLAEELALADSLRREAGKHLSEAFGLGDDLDRVIEKRIFETIGFAETYTDLISFVLAIRENLGFSEVLGKHTTRPLAESFQLAESVTKSAVKNVSEALFMAEAFGRTVAYRRAIDEGFAIADALSRAYGLKVNEALDLAEQYRRRANGVVSDMIVAATAITEQDFIDIMEAGHPPGFTDFRDFIQGDHTYRRALFRAILKSQNADRGFIDGLRVTVDVPDVFDRGSEQITSAASGVTVNFTRTFRVPPEVTITHKGGTVVAVPKLVGAVTTTGFSAVLEDSSGARVTGSFTWVAQGY